MTTAEAIAAAKNTLLFKFIQEEMILQKTLILTDEIMLTAYNKCDAFYARIQEDEVFKAQVFRTVKKLIENKMA
jgi:hypothetical protein